MARLEPALDVPPAGLRWLRSDFCIRRLSLPEAPRLPLDPQQGRAAERLVKPRIPSTPVEKGSELLESEGVAVRRRRAQLAAS
jgi:hypothetical protein